VPDIGVPVEPGQAALRRGRRDYADGVWGPGLAAIALTSAAVGSGDRWRRWTLAAATTAWAVRLERQMLTRLRTHDEEDPRYTEFLDGDSTAAVVTKVFVTQGLAQLLVSAPVQLAAASPLPRTARRWLFPAGIAVMLTGAVIEALADRQKTQFQQRGDDKFESMRLFGATSATIQIAEGDGWAKTIRVGDSSKRVGAGVPESQLKIGGRNMPGTIVVEGEAGPDTLVTQETNTIEIEAEAMSIPEQLTLSIEGADIGTQFSAGSITLPSGVNLISDPDMLVVNVVAAPTAEDLESEGAGEVAEGAEDGEAPAGEDEEAAEEASAEESE